MFADRLSQVQAGVFVFNASRGDGVQITFTQQHVGRALKFDLGSVFGVEQHPVADLDLPHVLPGRRDRTPAVAGMTMPAFDRRSPASSFVETRIRSCSILIGRRLDFSERLTV
jgi:hypothetical protein